MASTSPKPWACRFLVGVFALTCALMPSATPALADPTSPPQLPSVPGLEVRPHDPAVASVPSELVEALAAASSLQDSHPNEFGKAHVAGGQSFFRWLAPLVVRFWRMQ